MPNLRIDYTRNIEAEANIGPLCTRLARILIEQKDDAGKAVFPAGGGTRVFAYPVPYSAIAEPSQEDAFVYLTLRMLPGRSKATIQRIGDALLEAAKAHLAGITARRVGILVHLDESSAQIYSGRHNI